MNLVPLQTDYTDVHLPPFPAILARFLILPNRHDNLFGRRGLCCGSFLFEFLTLKQKWLNGGGLFLSTRIE